MHKTCESDDDLEVMLRAQAAAAERAYREGGLDRPILLDSYLTALRDLMEFKVYGVMPSAATDKHHAAGAVAG